MEYLKYIKDKNFSSEIDEDGNLKVLAIISEKEIYMEYDGKKWNFSDSSKGFTFHAEYLLSLDEIDDVSYFNYYVYANILKSKFIRVRLDGLRYITELLHKNYDFFCGESRGDRINYLYYELEQQIKFLSFFMNNNLINIINGYLRCIIIDGDYKDVNWFDYDNYMTRLHFKFFCLYPDTIVYPITFKNELIKLIDNTKLDYSTRDMLYWAKKLLNKLIF